MDNDAFPVVTGFLKRYAPENYAILGATGSGHFHPDQPDHSFQREYGRLHRPGQAVDMLLNHGGRTYFASLFFAHDRPEVEYRLGQVATPLPLPLKNSYLSLNDIGVQLLDHGRLVADRDPVATGHNVTGWLTRLIESFH